MSEALVALNLAQKALEKATEADGKINTHEELCTLRYTNINEGLTRLTKILTWGGGIMASMILSLLAWSLNNQVSYNADQIRKLQSVNAAEAAKIQYVPVPVGPDGEPALVMAPK